jgi:hypothetical protein
MPGWDCPARPAVYKAPIGAQVASPQSPILRWSTSRISALTLRTRGTKQKSGFDSTSGFANYKVSGFANYSCPVLLAPRHTRGTHEQHERAPPNLLPCTSLAPGLHLAWGPQSPPNHTALKRLQRGISPALVGNRLRVAQAERATRCRTALSYCTNIYSRG